MEYSTPSLIVYDSCLMEVLVLFNLQFAYFRSISGEEPAGDSDDEELDSDTEEQEAPSDYVKGECGY